MSVSLLQIMQWNVGKRREAQLSLLNDKGTMDFDVLLLQEPHSFTPRQQDKPVTATHHYWNSVLPTCFLPGAHGQRFRSMIYVNKRLSYQRIPIESGDLTAVVLKRGEDRILCISAYMAYSRNTRECKEILQQNLNLIEGTLTQVRQKYPQAQLVLGGDFNRHDPLWGRVGRDRLGEAEPLVQFILQHQLWSALPHSTITYHNNGNRQQTTIDLMLIPSMWRPAVQWCKTVEDHGSDHFPITIALQLARQRETRTYKYRCFNNVNWAEVQVALELRLGSIPRVQDKMGLDEAAYNFERIVQQTLFETIPAAKPFPYAKRWWTRELTNLRDKYHKCRNKWTRATQNGNYSEVLKQESKRSRNKYLHAIQVQKKKHWKDFLDDSSNIWKALAYLNQSDKTWTVPDLQVEGRVVEDDKEKAEVLLRTFFPTQPVPEGRAIQEGPTIGQDEILLRGGGLPGYLSIKPTQGTWSR